MKEVDFVKLTLWLAGLLIVAFFGGWLWFGRKITALERDIVSTSTICREVGEVAKDIKLLEDEKKNDKAPLDSADKAGILSYFSAQAQRSQFNPSSDYLFKPRDPEKNSKGGFVDQSFVVDFKKDKPKHRDQLMKFLYNCESQSRRIKLQKARLTLADENAVTDFWNADSLTFVRRDPAKSTAAGN